MAASWSDNNPPKPFQAMAYYGTPRDARFSFPTPFDDSRNKWGGDIL